MENWRARSGGGGGGGQDALNWTRDVGGFGSRQLSLHASTEEVYLLTGTDDAMDGVVAATGTQQKYSLHHPLSRDVDVLLCFLSEVLVTTWHFDCTVAVLSAQWLVEHVKNYYKIS